jgi:glycosyltransferase involved in cell wall biosynthesis
VPSDIRRLLIECSHTFYDGQRTGIQRVVRQLVAHGPGSGPDNVTAAPVIWTPLGFSEIEGLPARGRWPFRLIKAVAGGIYRAMTPTQRAEDGDGIKAAGPTSASSVESQTGGSDDGTANDAVNVAGRAAGEHAPRLNRDGGAGRRGLTAFAKRVTYSTACLLSQSITTLRGRTTLGAGDVLLLADASWNQPMWRDVAHAKARGCKIGIVLYDLIALEHPEWFDRPLALNFSEWIDNALTHADFFLPISQTTGDALRRVAAARGMAEPKIAVIPMGVDQEFGGREGTKALRHKGTEGKNPSVADATPVANSLGASVPQCLSAFPPGPVCLSVGTIEPRKNHALLLAAFDQVWQQSPEITLALVGRRGWQCGPIVTAIESHPQFNRRLFWFDRADDATLEALYRRAALLTVPSRAEGFGLPIIEGLIRHVPVLCADIPIFREVGGAACTYTPHDPAAWALQIHHLIAHPPQRITDFSWPNWSAAVAEAVNTAVSIAARGTS